MRANFEHGMGPIHIIIAIAKSGIQKTSIVNAKLTTRGVIRYHGGRKGGGNTNPLPGH